MIFKNYPFSPFLAPFTQTEGATTPKINTNLPFMVTNIISKFHNNPSITTQVIGRKPNFYRRHRRRLHHNIIRPQNFLQSYNKQTNSSSSGKIKQLFKICNKTFYSNQKDLYRKKMCTSFNLIEGTF